MPLKFTAQADGDLEIEIYDVVGFFGVNAKDFAARLKAAKGKNVTLRINSPGGSVIDGNVIANLIKAHDGQVTAYIDGLCGSIATVIACAAGKVIMADNAFYMIHNPSAGDFGTSDELRQVADVLDKMQANMVTAYMTKTGATKATVQKWMDESTWFSAKEAKKEGFVDEIGLAVADSAVAQFANYFPEKNFTAVAPATGGRENQNEGKPTMKPEEILALQNQVTSLEADKVTIAKAHATAVETAKNTATTEATNAAKTAEKTRKDGIQAISAKYNKNGDLNAITITALASDVTPEAFKDQVLDVVNGRPTKAAIVPPVAGSNGAEGDSADATAYAKFKTEYAACQSTEDRMELVRSNKVFARRLAREE